ncbi:putative MPP superfamily phosphohydrolase [Isoptericola sp. CG 20/1183]|uniref:MPP superfamily phosphohydrolase n=1 Tax=Isoptericola halotolerans TaxID=300560 RepID=A0ABX5EFS2_9MICO|nr:MULTISPECIES: metallophosphoesterase [Isoptericola]PRZ08254.1 putative MPP superfamily phosphohydrolase [Isoptericola halotolerans]PRZ09051.1 putative MPP superfamily phosphohydrolase [Isoptericola sp. CG 20/1183]
MLGGIVTVAAAGLAYAHLETKLFTVRHVTVPALPTGERDLRVLHVSDLHLTPTQHRKIAWVRSLAALEPDLVIDTGDNLAHREALGPLLHALEPLLEQAPGAFVMGSNDYYAPKPKNPARYLWTRSGPRTRSAPNLPAAELAAAMSGAGWVDLTNRRDAVVVDGRRIAFAGVDDPHLGLDDFPAPGPAHADEGEALLRLGVTHAPYTRVLDQMYADGADAIIAGHTHGGQLCVPFYGALVTNCDIDRRRAKGLHGWPGARPDAPDGEDSTWLHVSAGAGTSPYAPVRFACRPEATLITFTAR